MKKIEEWIVVYFRGDATTPSKKVFEIESELRDFVAENHHAIMSGEFGIISVRCVHTTKFDVRGFYPKM